MKHKHISDALIAIAMIAFVYFIFYLTHIGCPIKFITGISCFGCGMTRAYLSLLRLDFASAFHYHPLWIAPMLWVVAYAFKSRIPRTYKVICLSIIILFIAVYVIRISNGSDEIVVFEPENGLIFRGFRYIKAHI